MIGKAVAFPFKLGWRGTKATARGAKRLAMTEGGRRTIGATVIGGGALAGVASGILDDTGPYPRIQEQAFGSRETLKYSIKAGAVNALRKDEDLYGFEDYYYGKTVNTSRRRGNTVPGEVVFGAYNMRRG